MRMSDWSSDVCSSDLGADRQGDKPPPRDGEMMLNLQNVPGLFRRSNGQQESNVSGLLDPNVRNQALQLTPRFTFPNRSDRDLLPGRTTIMLGSLVTGSTGMGDQRARLEQLTGSPMARR